MQEDSADSSAKTFVTPTKEDITIVTTKILHKNLFNLFILTPLSFININAYIKYNFIICIISQIKTLFSHEVYS